MPEASGESYVGGPRGRRRSAGGRRQQRRVGAGLDVGRRRRLLERSCRHRRSTTLYAVSGDGRAGRRGRRCRRPSTTRARRDAPLERRRRDLVSGGRAAAERRTRRASRRCGPAAVTSSPSRPAIWSPRAAPEVCYADVERCLQDSVVVLHASDDGDRWRAVDTTGIGSRRGRRGRRGHRDRGRPGGRDAGPARTARGCTRGRPARRCRRPETADASRDRSSWSQVPEGERAGARASATTRRCTCTAAWTGSTSAIGPGGAPTTGRRSRRVPAGPGSPDWPIAQQMIFGYATLVDGVVEYSLDGR